MIELNNINKVYETRGGKHKVLSNVNFVIHPGERVGILGRNGSGKSTMIRMISGAERPTSGSVTRSMTTSWPIAFSGAFQSALTGYDNVRFIFRIYGKDLEDRIEFIDDFAQLGHYLREPVKHYSSGMRARLSFAISMAVDFDCYLIDEVVAVGDARFRQKCEEELFIKRAERAKIIVSHDITYVLRHCDRAAVLVDGNLVKFEDISEAHKYYVENC